nr:SpoIIE family protein phosphatase [Actinomycetospora chiangmaiensis]
MATESDVRAPSSAERRGRRAPPVVGRRPGTTSTATPGGRVGIETPERVAAVRASRLLEDDGDDTDGTFDRVARLAARLLDAPTAFVTVVDDRTSVITGWSGPVGPPGHPRPRPRRLPARDAACQLVVDTGTEVVVPDVREDDRTRDLPGLALMAARSWIGQPITDAAGFVLGNLCVIDGEVREWTDEEVAGLRDLASVLERTVRLRGIAAALRTYADQAEDLAVTLQQVLLPAWIPTVPGIEIATRFQPGGTGAEVLGDFYDVLLHDDGFSVVIGDVAGRGPSAARTASLARSAVRTAASADQDPVSVLSTVHRVLRHDGSGPGRFVTIAYASFERGAPTAGGSSRWDVVVCSAGHPPGFVIGPDGAVTAIRAGVRWASRRSPPSTVTRSRSGRASRSCSTPTG